MIGSSSSRQEPMNRIATAGKWLRAWLASHRVEMALCLRVTVSAVLTFVAAQLLNLAIALWAVLTAVILTQLSVGRSVKATTDYFVATVGAAIYAGLVGTQRRHLCGAGRHPRSPHPGDFAPGGTCDRGCTRRPACGTQSAVQRGTLHGGVGAARAHHHPCGSV